VPVEVKGWIPACAFQMIRSFFSEAEILGIIRAAAEDSDDTALSVYERARTPEKANQERKAGKPKSIRTSRPIPRYTFLNQSAR
jgi:hypothetical protein